MVQPTKSARRTPALSRPMLWHASGAWAQVLVRGSTAVRCDVPIRRALLRAVPRAAGRGGCGPRAAGRGPSRGPRAGKFISRFHVYKFAACGAAGPDPNRRADPNRLADPASEAQVSLRVPGRDVRLPRGLPSRVPPRPAAPAMIRGPGGAHGPTTSRRFAQPRPCPNPAPMHTHTHTPARVRSRDEHRPGGFED
jgi:hypothetical protein